MGRRTIRVRTIVAFSAVTLALSPILALSASASGPGPNTWTSVGQGVNPATIPNVVVFQGTNITPTTPETVSFILDERNIQQLEAQTERGFNHFLSVSEFAQQYGQSQSNIDALTSYLGTFGITSTVMADDVDVQTAGTAGEYNQALNVTQNSYGAPADPSGQGHHSFMEHFHGPTTSPQLPYRLAQFVLAEFGLTNYSPYASETASRALGSTPTKLTPPAASSPAAATYTPSECIAETGFSSDCNLPQDFAADYGMSQLDRHADGSGETLAIVTLAALDPGILPGDQWAAQDFWGPSLANIPRTGSLNVVNVDGGPGAASLATGSDETDIDVEQSGGVAPGANVIVYQAPNTDAGYADAFFEAASQNIASSVSASWGESETYVAEAVASGEETSAYQSVFDEAFLELAAQGQSGFVAAGDDAAYDTNSANEYGPYATTNLSVDIPAASPYITAGGGTTLPLTGTITAPSASGTGTTTVTLSNAQQRAWGWDYLWQPIATLNGAALAPTAESLVVGTGGGFSANEPTPSYQYGVSGTQSFNDVKYLTPTDYQNVNGIFAPTEWNFNATPSVSRGFGNGRALPDISANADPESGYFAWIPSFGAAAALEIFGGTSFIGPQMNGVAAVIDSSLGGQRIGFWNPQIYQFAQQQNSPFTTLQQAGTNNDNIYYTGNPGALFNEATGLGIPNISALARDFANG
ncbi:MAG: S53 family peptidase [Acidimicrobiales bacterium]